MLNGKRGDLDVEEQPGFGERLLNSDVDVAVLSSRVDAAELTSKTDAPVFTHDVDGVTLAVEVSELQFRRGASVNISASNKSKTIIK